jgi:hypothetical protein
VVIVCPPAACTSGCDVYLGAMRLLDPKLDVVFEMLFAEERNRALLESLLTAVLRPPSPIVRVRVINPELPKDGWSCSAGHGSFAVRTSAS